MLVQFSTIHADSVFQSYIYFFPSLGALFFIFFKKNNNLILQEEQLQTPWAQVKTRRFNSVR